MERQNKKFGGKSNPQVTGLLPIMILSIANISRSFPALM
jgi:hypothetical protein